MRKVLQPINKLRLRESVCVCTVQRRGRDGIAHGLSTVSERSARKVHAVVESVTFPYRLVVML